MELELDDVDPTSTGDEDTWSLKRIIARTQAWDRAKDAEVRAARELAQEQAAARMLLEAAGRSAA
ncbi:hypothetical protein HaLaN_26931 [Haematococcus lacustris]|uniref:Uncharacterized protein n=1 Tax=Haematococcus lacustris TaxID=44745 RepID=A0A6A0A7I1_HAELA|nr:hypothetical protein HaLaN_26931 [Haematococcus lacustris]